MSRSRWMTKTAAIATATMLGALLAVLSAAATPAREAGAQDTGEQVKVTGTVEQLFPDVVLAEPEPETCGGVPCPEYGLTDEASGTNYGLLGEENLKPYLHERVTVYGTVEVEGNLGGPTLLNVFWIGLAGGGKVFQGAPTPEAFYGTIDSDRIFGRGGGDLIKGNSGNDKLRGNDGDDLIIGEAGADLVAGGPGDDALYAAYSPAGSVYDAPASPDVIYGGKGDDFIDSADRAGAPDTVYCGPGGDLVLADNEDFVADDCEAVYRY